jgi:hypothetical protein
MGDIEGIDVIAGYRFGCDGEDRRIEVGTPEQSVFQVPLAPRACANKYPR